MHFLLKPNNFHTVLFYLANIMILKVLMYIQSFFKYFKLKLHRENSIKVSGWLLGEDFTIGYCKDSMYDVIN